MLDVAKLRAFLGSSAEETAEEAAAREHAYEQRCIFLGIKYAPPNTEDQVAGFVRIMERRETWRSATRAL
jgi:hypothetical protein